MPLGLQCKKLLENQFEQKEFNTTVKRAVERMYMAKMMKNKKKKKKR